MSERKDKFSADLDDLLRRGTLLELAITRECDNQKFDKLYTSSFGKEKLKELLEELPDFKEEYQSWYSESMALIRQILPDRLGDFVSYYEYPRTRKDITFANYMIRDYLQGLIITRNTRAGTNPKVLVDGSAAIPEFKQQLNIVRAAKDSLSSTLVDLTLILQAELFDSEIGSAVALAKAGYRRAAGAICGVVIEKHLKQVCTNHAITIRKKNVTIFELCQTLRDGNIISVPQWRFVQHLADIRNLCDHDKGKEPTNDEITDLTTGTKKILKSMF